MARSGEHLFLVEVTNFSSLDEPITREEARRILWTTLHRHNKWSEVAVAFIREENDD